MLKPPDDELDPAPPEWLNANDLAEIERIRTEAGATPATALALLRRAETRFPRPAIRSWCSRAIDAIDEGAQLPELPVLTDQMAEPIDEVRYPDALGHYMLLQIERDHIIQARGAPSTPTPVAAPPAAPIAPPPLAAPEPEPAAPVPAPAAFVPGGLALTPELAEAFKKRDEELREAAAAAIAPATLAQARAAAEQLEPGDAAAADRVVDVVARCGAVDPFETAAIVAVISKKSGFAKKTIADALKLKHRGNGHALVDRSGAAAPSAAWRNQLDVNSELVPRPTVSNVVLSLTGDPGWLDTGGGSILAFDEFAGTIVLKGWAPFEAPDPNNQHIDRPWTDADTRCATVWVQGSGRGIPATSGVVHEAVQHVAEQNGFHPLRDLLKSFRPDPVVASQFDRWLSVYCGAGDTELTRAIGARWLIGAVARAFRPGCQNDSMLVLEGPQGAGKSSVFAILGGAYYTDEISDLSNKDAAIGLQGKWIVEFGELDAMSRSEVGRVKLFVSRRTDRFRSPYGRVAQDFPRQCVFGATTNESDYLRDATGGRRFWPVAVGHIDLAALRRDAGALWAEALRRLDRGDSWYLDDPALIAAAQLETEQRTEVGDAYEGDIVSWLGVRRDQVVSTAEVMIGALFLTDRAKWSKSLVMQVAGLIRRQGWTPHPWRRPRCWFYVGSHEQPTREPGEEG